MEKEYRVVCEPGSGETEEKKSRFIAYIEPVESEEQVNEFVERIRKKHWDARHNCVAAVIGENNEFSRCSDDGEPAGTAGKPMLETLINEGIHNAAVVVTRYFGGTLLGTGGLVRAYQAAVKEGLKNCRTASMKSGCMVGIITDYMAIGKLQYIMSSMDIFVVDTDYGENVEMTVMVEKEKIAGMCDRVTEATSGKAVITVGDEEKFGICGGELIL